MIVGTRRDRKIAKARAKKAAFEGWQGEGWYRVRFWDVDDNDWMSPEIPGAEWLESPYDFELACTLEGVAPEDYEAKAEYLGDGEKPVEAKRRSARRVSNHKVAVKRRSATRRKTASEIRASIFVATSADPDMGEWVDLPCSDGELARVIEHAKQLTDADDVVVSSVEGIPGAQGEGYSPQFLNGLVRAAQDGGVPAQAFYSMCRKFDLVDLALALPSGTAFWYEGVADNADLGRAMVDEFGVGSIDHIEDYIDYEKYGRDLAIDGGWEISNGYAVKVF